jgi:hypothetical protein
MASETSGSFSKRSMEPARSVVVGGGYDLRQRAVLLVSLSLITREQFTCLPSVFEFK